MRRMCTASPKQRRAGGAQNPLHALRYRPGRARWSGGPWPGHSAQALHCSVTILRHRAAPLAGTPPVTRPRCAAPPPAPRPQRRPRRSFGREGVCGGVGQGGGGGAHLAAGCTRAGKRKIAASTTGGGAPHNARGAARARDGRAAPARSPRMAVPHTPRLNRSSFSRAGGVYHSFSISPPNTKGYSSTYLAMGFANVRAGTWCNKMQFKKKKESR